MVICDCVAQLLEGLLGFPLLGIETQQARTCLKTQRETTHVPVFILDSLDRGPKAAIPAVTTISSLLYCLLQLRVIAI